MTTKKTDFLKLPTTIGNFLKRISGKESLPNETSTIDTIATKNWYNKSISTWHSFIIITSLLAGVMIYIVSRIGLMLTIITIKHLLSQYPLILTLICAELFFVLVRSQDIILVLKSKHQRTEEQNLQAEQGLKISLVLEAFLFVPASIILFRLSIFPLIRNKLFNIEQDIATWYSLMGIVGYSFPFVTVRKIITRITLSTLKEFAEITQQVQIKE